MGTVTEFRAKPYKQGQGSWVVVIPKSKFTENIMQEDKEYNFIVQEVESNSSGGVL